MSNTGIGCRGDDALTFLVDFLEQEAEIFASSHPLVHVKRVLRAIEYACDSRVLEPAQVVIVSVNNHRIVPDFSTFNSQWLETTDSLGKSECQETDSGHESEDDADDSDFFSPCPLGFRCSFTATALECPVWDTDGQKVAVDHPSGFRTGNEIAKARTAVGFVLASIDFVDLRRLGCFVGL
jgi:hypothetical protein